MEDNPFIKLINKIREDSELHYPTTHRFGRVISINPLKVEIGNLIFSKDELLKNSQLITFEVGDDLLLLPIDNEQRFAILAKVVQV